MECIEMGMLQSTYFIGATFLGAVTPRIYGGSISILNFVRPCSGLLTNIHLTCFSSCVCHYASKVVAGQPTSDVPPCLSAASSGLQLFVARDGSTTLS